MFLLITRTGNVDGCQLFPNRDDAIATAREIIGAHYPADSCSCEPHEMNYGEIFTSHRSSSFGTRRAIVQPIGSSLSPFRSL